jgi:MFS family permease
VRALETQSPSARAGSDRRLLAVLVLAVVGFAFQQTAIVPAVQTVQASLHGSKEWSAWLVTVYLIVATVATPAMGRLADLYGRRRLLVIGLVVFTLGSVAAAFAPNLPVLICCRAVQGVGGSVYPLCLAIAREQVPRERVTAAVAALTGAFGLGTAVGFVAGGLLAQYASWRWIFVVGAILVTAGTIFLRSVPSGGDRASGSYDWPGTVVLAVAAIGLLTALTLVVPFGWASPVIAGLLAVAGAAAAVWVHIEASRADPLVDVHVLRQPRLVVVNLATIGLGWGLFSSYLLIPLFVQKPPGPDGFGLGGTASLTGWLLLPLALGQMLTGPLAGWLSPRLGAHRVFAAGTVAVAAAFGLLCLTRHSPGLVAAAGAVLGIGAGLALQASSDVATQGVEADVAAVSSAVNSTVRRLAGGVGGQISTIVLAVPTRGAFVVCYLVAVVLNLVGAALVLSPAASRDGGRADRAHQRPADQ